MLLHRMLYVALGGSTKNRNRTKNDTEKQTKEKFAQHSIVPSKYFVYN